MTTRNIGTELINKRPLPVIEDRLRQRVNISEKRLADFCRKNHIKSLSLFGSVLREDFRPDSDVDILVEFQPDRTPGLLKMARMESELSLLFAKRKVDLRTPQDLSHHFRDRVMHEAVALCRQ
jgi:uncharacterized protein